MYRITTDTEVEAQIEAMPDNLLPHLAQLLDALEIVPWNSTPYNESLPHGVMRTVTFGPPGSTAQAIFLIIEDQQRVDLLRIIWVG